MVEIPFDRVEHLVRIPVRLPGGETARFLVDTGIGITVVSPTLVERCGLAATGHSYTGHRMSGQAVQIPLVELPHLDLGGRLLAAGTAGQADLGPADGANGFDGILGLDLLGELPLTIDPFRSTVALGAVSGPTTRHRIEVPVRPHRDGPAVDLLVELQLPDGTVTEVEIDTGSAETILDTRFMPACSVDGSETAARTVEGVDQTGHPFVRRFIPIDGAVALAAAPGTALPRPTVMFQDLALNGLIGTTFLDRYVQTYDTGRAILTLAPPQGA
ncbi:hypothetical protein Athai_47920 [Actinocatenispora thailandica]|uniref:Peptidase A2 domain-containing protein n=1 Tax=Actinocatenispora thailandica TaxID=227318 RepID=A0A7R7DSZ7_9ACTN|nr:retropepsin-like aspartic protease [Actinocatenispora thailandica]BCJ37289.1 hypothetical protein Athai_47920 [Actinocatenispora thailandica]